METKLSILWTMLSVGCTGMISIENGTDTIILMATLNSWRFKMWILIILTNIYDIGIGAKATSPNITTTEISSRDRCIKAAEFIKKQPNISNAFCVQK